MSSSSSKVDMNSVKLTQRLLLISRMDSATDLQGGVKGGAEGGEGGGGGAYVKATQPDFLRKAGQLSLTSMELQNWLTQDRLYALAGYAPFLGLLIAKCPLAIAGPSDSQSQLHRKRLTVLASAMANIDREVGFFEDVARENDLDLSSKGPSGHDDRLGLGLLNPITRGYIDYMVSVSSRGTFEEALVLLWAMEKLYLDAWTFASTFLSPDHASPHPKGAARALLSLIPNWSSPEFATFVDNIADLVDGLDVPAGSELEKRCVDVWRTTLWFEERFWEAGTA